MKLWRKLCRCRRIIKLLHAKQERTTTGACDRRYDVSSTNAIIQSDAAGDDNDVNCVQQRQRRRRQRNVTASRFSPATETLQHGLA